MALVILRKLNKSTPLGNCILRDSIVSSNAIVSNMIAAQTIIGNDARACGVTHQLNVGDSSEINLA